MCYTLCLRQLNGGGITIHVIPSKDAEEGTGRAAGMLMFAFYLLDGQGWGALEMTARSSSKSFALRYQANA